MRVEIGSRVILVAGVDELWHLPDGDSATAALCGLQGMDYSYASTIRRRRACGVCRQRHRFEDVFVAELGPLPDRRLRRGGRPKGSVSKIRPHHLPVLHKLYVEQQLSCRKIGELVWEQLGYKTARSCGEALYKAFHEHGYELRSQSEATSLRNFRHGRGGSDRDEGAYRRWFKETHGRYQPVCKGVKKNPPRKGSPCTRHAMEGSDFCFSHDPERAAQRNAMAAGMRERLELADVVPADDLRAALLAYRSRGGRWRDLAAAAGVPDHYLSHVAAGGFRNVSSARARLVFDALEPALEAAA